MKGIFKKKMVYVVMFMVLIGTIFIFQRKAESEKLLMSGYIPVHITWEKSEELKNLPTSGHIPIYVGLEKSYGWFPKKDRSMYQIVYIAWKESDRLFPSPELEHIIASKSKFIRIK